MDSANGAMGRGGRRWFAVRTQPRKERLALGHLARQGFETFCPMWRGAARQRRHVRPPLAPLFPSYVFAALDLEHQRWRSINGTIGCIGLVSFGTRPAALPADFVDAMRKASEDDGEVGFAQELTPGARVRVVGGTFDNMCGTLLEKSGTERVAILLDVLNRATRVEIASARLIAA
jgi:transcriptional antiterminator RfaH